MKPIQWRKEKKVESLIFIWVWNKKNMFSKAIGEIVKQGSKTDTTAIKTNF